MCLLIETQRMPEYQKSKIRDVQKLVEEKLVRHPSKILSLTSALCYCRFSARGVPCWPQQKGRRLGAVYMRGALNCLPMVLKLKFRLAGAQLELEHPLVSAKLHFGSR